MKINEHVVRVTKRRERKERKKERIEKSPNELPPLYCLRYVSPFISLFAGVYV